jgi:hypothetical protein
MGEGVDTSHSGPEFEKQDSEKLWSKAYRIFVLFRR